MYGSLNCCTCRSPRRAFVEGCRGMGRGKTVGRGAVTGAFPVCRALEYARGVEGERGGNGFEHQGLGLLPQPVVAALRRRNQQRGQLGAIVGGGAQPIAGIQGLLLGAKHRRVAAGPVGKSPIEAVAVEGEQGGRPGTAPGERIRCCMFRSIADASPVDMTAAAVHQKTQHQQGKEARAGHTLPPWACHMGRMHILWYRHAYFCRRD